MIEHAVIVCAGSELPESPLLQVQIGGLPLFTRALLALKQAGLRRLHVVADDRQRAALEPRVAEEGRLGGMVEWHGPEVLLALPRSLVSAPSLVLEPRALRAWLDRAEDGPAILAPEESEAGPYVVSPSALAASVAAGRSGLSGLIRFLRQAWDEGRVRFLRWEGVPPLAVSSISAVPGVERTLLGGLGTPEDGPIVDRFVNRAVSSRLTRHLLSWPITPNQITMLSLLAGLLGAWILQRAGLGWSLAGLGLFQLSVILDHADGELARMRFQFSRFGKWLDNWSDHAVDLAVVACLARRAAGTMSTPALVALALAAAVGVTTAFIVVFRWSLLQEGGKAATGRPGEALIRSMANRDGFTLALWSTVLLGQPLWFLWTLALGANAYWLAWLAIHGCAASPRRATGALGLGKPQGKRRP
jgi:phosphatidylglycerophosphate synthase